MRVTPPTAALYGTLAATVAVTLLLACLLARPSSGLTPDRSPRAFELDEPPRSAPR